MRKNQLNLYDILGKETDPIYQLVSTIKVGETKSIGVYSIILNSYGIYEVSHSDVTHDSKSSLEDCYKYLVENQIFF